VTGSAATNWAGNITYTARTVHRPGSVEQLQELVARAPRVHVLGSRHSFNRIADSAELVSLTPSPTGQGFPAGIEVDGDARTVSLGGGVTYAQLADALRGTGWALHNLASLPHISVAGAVATATHGSGVGNGNLATAVTALELVTSDGELRRLDRGDDCFAGAVVGLGALGAVTRLTLALEPAYEVRQRVYDHLPWPALEEHLEEVLAAGYSVSLFTLLGGDLDMAWVKSRTDRPDPLGDELLGARAADGERHPIPGLDPSTTTQQRGVAGPWSDRLPHFRPEFTPSNGDELQSEWLVPRDRAAEAIAALRSQAGPVRPALQTCELRTVAADDLWLSTAQGRDSFALHFTWRPDGEVAGRAVRALEEALAPLGARPHWGKVFTAGAADLAPLYERHADFCALVARLDPRGAFRNDWLERHVLGG
jgi:xylitol oxidase